MSLLRRWTFDLSLRLANPARYPLTSLLNEGYLVDLPQGSDPGPHPLQRGVAQEGHAPVAGFLADLRAGALFEEHLADLVVELEQLVDGRTAAIAGAAALDATRTLLEDDVAPLSGIE